LIRINLCIYSDAGANIALAAKNRLNHCRAMAGRLGLIEEKSAEVETALAAEGNVAEFNRGRWRL
jgi:hypothetical protein